ncbi:hypothetical protein EVAR_70855_1 [Eumeta japonica]|uniref:Uncharacterized protein n=1 Tax=Eumeta variegata TaxID=151549 RepID=A0A4C1SIM9_EUMVA|nr:hypothetical protein EVAR_70855_1 [Eumeta japonica]
MQPQIYNAPPHQVDAARYYNDRSVCARNRESDTPALLRRASEPPPMQTPHPELKKHASHPPMIKRPSVSGHKDEGTARLIYFSSYDSLMTYEILRGHSADVKIIFVLRMWAIRAVYKWNEQPVDSAPDHGPIIDVNSDSIIRSDPGSAIPITVLFVWSFLGHGC